MKIIHSLWTKGWREGISNMGWPTTECMLMCWALSCLLAKRLYGQIALLTDHRGKALLIDRLQLPYTEVHNVFDDSLLADIPAHLWAVGKIYAYSLQREPFVHIDGDAFFLDKIDLDAPIIAQHVTPSPEYEDELHRYLHSEMHDSHSLMADFVRGPVCPDEYNMGIFGGTDLDLIREYCEGALDFARESARYADRAPANANWNCFIEQYFLTGLCLKKGIDTKLLMTDQLADDTDCPGNWISLETDGLVGYNHYGGTAKLCLSNIDRVYMLMYNLYPEYYERVRELCRTENRQAQDYFAADNPHYSSDFVHRYLEKHFARSGAEYTPELKADFQTHLELKAQLLAQRPAQLPQLTPRHETLALELRPTDEVCLSPRYIGSQKVEHTWDSIYESKLHINLKDWTYLHDGTPAETYHNVAYYYTSYIPSVSSLPISDAQLLILNCVLSTDYRSVESIARRIQLLNQNRVNDFGQVLKHTRHILHYLNAYGLISIRTTGETAE